MKPTRSLFLAVLIVTLFSIIDVYSQTPDNPCPRIEVAGPASISPGQPISFTAHVYSIGRSIQPSYQWTISSGKIDSGQGTQTIVTEWRGDGLTATVDIGGLPAGCPSSFSETLIYDPQPIAEKIFEVSGVRGLSELNVALLAKAAHDHPNDQFYAIIRDSNRVSNVRRQNELVKALRSIGVVRDRVTIVTVFADPNVTQFFRVPPGADNPAVDQIYEKNEQNTQANSCPTISVTGPAGVVQLGEPMTFSVNIDPETAVQLKFSWDVTKSVIMGGQGTRVLLARYLPEAHGSDVVATVTVAGLPPSCPNTASALYPVCIGLAPILIGVISDGSYAIDKETLDDLTAEMQNPNSQLYVWIYSQDTERQITKLKARILRQLSTTKIDPNRFTIRVSSVRSYGVTFWRIPPGADDPSP